jgi:hypothetical protein
MDEEVVEDNETLQRIRNRKRGRQYAERSQADLDRPVEG